jgi:hypothetical protein
VTAGQRSDQLPHLDDLARVKTIGRLVEDEDIRIVNQSLGECGTLAIAAG